MADSRDAQDLDECLKEVNHGCQMARELETKLNSAQGPDLYELLWASSVEIVSTFGHALEMLRSNSSPSCLDNWQEELKVLLEKQLGGLEVGHSQKKSVKDNRNSSPRSGGRSSLSGSPPSDMSDGSPVRSLATPGKFKRNDPADTTENERASSKDKRGVSRKRKSLPKWTKIMPANSSEPGNDVPPEDGYTWRKYGQKDILGAQHPRSYYRCTHKHDLGCQATKKVQRPDDNPSVFEVTYSGVHSCQNDARLLQLPFPISQIPGSNTICNSRTPTTLVFGTDSNLQSNTSSTGNIAIFPSTHFLPSSSAPWFAAANDGGVCPVKSESMDSFGKSPSYSPNVDSSAHSAIPFTSHPADPIYRIQGSEKEFSADFIRHHQQNEYPSTFLGGELEFPNFAPFFCSPSTSESNYLPPPTPLMQAMDPCRQRSQASESDITEVVSTHTSVTDSPMLEMDHFPSVFTMVNLDSIFERTENFDV